MVDFVPVAVRGGRAHVRLLRSGIYLSVPVRRWASGWRLRVGVDRSDGTLVMARDRTEGYKAGERTRILGTARLVEELLKRGAVLGTYVQESVTDEEARFRLKEAGAKSGGKRKGAPAQV